MEESGGPIEEECVTEREAFTKYCFSIDPETTLSTSMLVYEAVERADERPMSDVEPISNRLDADALDDLFSPRPNGVERAAGTVTFSLDRYRITVRSNERIIVKV